MRLNDRLIGVLIATVIIVASTIFLLLIGLGETPDDLENEGLLIKLNEDQFMNFTMNSSVDINVQYPNLFPAYSITKLELTNESANATIVSMIGIYMKDVLTFKNETLWYSYLEIDGCATHFLYKDGRYRYSSESDITLFDPTEIIEDEKLFNESEALQLGRRHLIQSMGDPFFEFSLSERRTSVVTSLEGTFIKSYYFRYSRHIEGIPIFDDDAGSVYVRINPEGKVLSYSFHCPEIKPMGTTNIINITAALKTVDDDFANYRKHLPYSPNKYVLYDYTPSYGLVDDRLIIGWKLNFYCANAPNTVGETFVA